MIRQVFATLFTTILLLAGGALSAAHAQAVNDSTATQNDLPAPQNRAQMLRSLGLTKTQLEQIRAVNREYQPAVREANQRMKAANQALDDAVYSGETAAVIHQRLTEAQTAHSIWLKNRTDYETAIGRILNADQLQRFRRLRTLNREANQQRRVINQNQPAAPRLNGFRRQLRNRQQP